MPTVVLWSVINGRRVSGGNPAWEELSSPECCLPVSGRVGHMLGVGCAASVCVLLGRSSVVKVLWNGFGICSGDRWSSGSQDVR